MPARGPDEAVSVAGAVRPLGALDLDCAADLHRLCFDAPWDRPWSRAEFASLLATPGCFGLASHEAGAAAGFVLARVAADEAEILTLGVAPGFRRRGIGGALVAAACISAASRGAARMFLEVAADNPAACALYAAHGFVAVGERAAYYARGGAPPVAAVSMRRDLPA